MLCSFLVVSLIVYGFVEFGKRKFVFLFNEMVDEFAEFGKTWFAEFDKLFGEICRLPNSANFAVRQFSALSES